MSTGRDTRDGSPGAGEAERAVARAKRRLKEAVDAYGGGAERRHEQLMELAEERLGLERAWAEQVYALAEEESLEPAYALHLVDSGLGVRELEPPEQDADDTAAQQAPPEWVAEDVVELDDAGLERRLRASFRRLRSHLDASATPADAVESYAAEPDVTVLRLRP